MDQREYDTQQSSPYGTELAQVVETVRQQLDIAARTAGSAETRFEVGDIEMEFTIAVTEATKAEGGLKLWVLNAGASADATRGTTHRIKLVLRPLAADGTPRTISDRLLEPPR